MKVVSLYAVFADCPEAERIAQVVIDEKLAACVNLLGPIRSIFRWNGAVETADEFAAIFKTSEAQADALIGRIAELHSYDVPCLVTWPIDRILKGYADWVEDTVG